MAGDSVTIEDLKKKMAEFARERDWEPFHSPRNLLLALIGEVGELSEIFQWKGEVPKGLPDWKEEEKQHLGRSFQTFCSTLFSSLIFVVLILVQLLFVRSSLILSNTHLSYESV